MLRHFEIVYRFVMTIFCDERNLIYELATVKSNSNY